MRKTEVNINALGTINTCSSKICVNPWELKPDNLKDGPKHFFPYRYAHDRTVLSIALDESGIYMATASADHSIRIHNLKTLTTTKELCRKDCGHTDWVNKVFFTKQNEILSGGLDGILCLWNTSMVCKFPKNSKEEIYDIEKYMEIEKKVKEIHFKVSTNTLKCKQIVAHFSTISDMKLDKQNNKCITSSYDKTLKLFDFKKMKEEQLYKGNHFAPITKFLWIENKIITADKNGSLCIFDYQTSQEISNAQNAHHGNIGDMGCLYLNEHNDIKLMELETVIAEKQKKEKENENELIQKEQIDNRNGKQNVSIITSQFLFGNKDYHLNPTQESGIPLIITGGQKDGIISIRDWRIFKKEINKKRIHEASVNSILTYNWHNKNFVISCAADGYCYQFEITNLCESNLNNFCKKIYVKEPILTARYIGNHQLLVGTCYGNVLLLNFGYSYDENCNYLNEEETVLIKANKGNSSVIHKEIKKTVLDESKNCKHKNADILWGYGTCSKGGINTIECTFIYNTKKLQKHEIELHSVISAGDDGCPSVLFFPHKYL